MQPFYRWGRAWPFRLNVEATKIIFYDTQPPHILGQYIGGLMAWAFAGIIVVILAQLLDRWRMEKGQRQEKQNKASQVDEKANETSRLAEPSQIILIVQYHPTIKLSYVLLTIHVQSNLPTGDLL